MGGIAAPRAQEREHGERLRQRVGGGATIVDHCADGLGGLVPSPLIEPHLGLADIEIVQVQLEVAAGAEIGSGLDVPFDDAVLASPCRDPGDVDEHAGRVFVQ